MAYLVFDLGATKSRLALSSDGESLGEPVIVPTNHAAEGFDEWLAQVKELITGQTIEGVAGGVAGVIDRADGHLVHAPNLPAWEGLPVSQRLEDLIGVSVHLDNDVAMVGLGEATVGAAKGTPLAAYLTVSTGVNGVRLVDGRIDRSVWGFEIGQQILPGDDGRPTTFEAMVGGAALERRYHRLPRQIAQSPAWKFEARHLALGLYNTILHWSPELIVLGGSMMRDIKLDELEAELKLLPPVFDGLPRLESASLGEIGGLHGALAYLRQQQSHST